MRWINIPSRTFTWTLEYPLVTFLTLLITLDISAAEGLLDKSERYDSCFDGDRMMVGAALLAKRQ